jgi:hypothetical protein
MVEWSPTVRSPNSRICLGLSSIAESKSAASA